MPTTTRERYSKSLYHPGGSPMIVNAVHEHSVQQITFWRCGSIFQHSQMLVVLRHGETELSDSRLAVFQQTPPEISVGPGARDHFDAISQNPILSRNPGEFVHEAGGDQ